MRTSTDEEDEVVSSKGTIGVELATAHSFAEDAGAGGVVGGNEIESKGSLSVQQKLEAIITDWEESKGLTNAEAQCQLEKYGRNELPDNTPSLWIIFCQQVLSSFFCCSLFTLCLFVRIFNLNFVCLETNFD
jgi:hypothetical protein